MAAKILLVDDEQSIRESLGKLLRAEGYQIVLAENGEEAIQRMDQEPFDILVLDIGLPVKDGWATLRWLAQTNPAFPVIAITGRWKQGELAEAAGVDVLMEKPLNVPMLLQHIRELLQESPGASSRKRCFKNESCDTVKFSEQLQQRIATPYPSGVSTHSQSIEYEKGHPRS